MLAAEVQLLLDLLIFSMQLFEKTETNWLRAFRTSGESWPVQPPQRSFFSNEIATQILSTLERVPPPQAEPIADSTDMESSAALGELFADASTPAKDLHHDKVEPLHLVAAMLPMHLAGSMRF